MVKVRASCDLYTKEPFPQSHGTLENNTRSSCVDLSLSLSAGMHGREWTWKMQVLTRSVGRSTW